VAKLGSFLVLDGCTYLEEDSCTSSLLSVVEDKNGGRMAPMVGADGRTVPSVVVDNGCTASSVVENKDNSCTTSARVNDGYMALIRVKDCYTVAGLSGGRLHGVSRSK